MTEYEEKGLELSEHLQSIVDNDDVPGEVSTQYYEVLDFTDLILGKKGNDDN